MPAPFPATPLPATLTPDEYDRLTKLITVHYAYPLPYPMAGAYFEELFAAAVGGEREERKKLFDVRRNDTGWSLKTLLVSRLGAGASFEVVVQRCDILKDRKLSLDSPEPVLGESVVRHFSAFCEESAKVQAVADTRAGFLIRSRNERNFAFFQQRYRLYAPDEVKWRWANTEKRSLMGFVGDTLVFRWYRSGTQLFGVYRIPDEAHQFHIDWRRAGLDETIAFFTRSGVARLDADTSD